MITAKNEDPEPIHRLFLENLLKGKPPIIGSQNRRSITTNPRNQRRKIDLLVFQARGSPCVGFAEARQVQHTLENPEKKECYQDRCDCQESVDKGRSSRLLHDNPPNSSDSRVE